MRASPSVLVAVMAALVGAGCGSGQSAASKAGDQVCTAKADIQKNPAIFQDKAMASKLEQLKDLTTAQRRVRNRMWTEIKAGR